MEIAAMHHRIRVAEARAKGFAQIDMGGYQTPKTPDQPISRS